MKIAYVGGVIPPSKLNTYQGPSVAGNNMQTGLLKAISKRYPKDLFVIAQKPIARFPLEKSLFHFGQEVILDQSLVAHQVGFINLPLIKQWMMCYHTGKKLKRWAKKHQGKKSFIIIFNALPQVAKPALKVAKKYHLKVISILADPPIDPIQRNALVKLFKDKENKTSEKLIQKLDGLIVLNEQMAKDYAPKLPYIIMEGAMDVTHTFTQNHNVNQTKTILYTGALTKYSGVLELMASSEFIEAKDYQIVIYGDGPYKDEVIKQAASNSHIIYQGVVSNEMMRAIQKKAYVLINPRCINDPVSTYTFPSKMLEYMISGRPVLSTHLNGLTSAYKKHLYMLEGDDPKSIAKGIDLIILEDPKNIKQVTQAAYMFIKDEKSYQKQASRILNLMHTLSK